MSEEKRGLLVAVEGIDGSGKSTVARELARHLREEGLKVTLRQEPSQGPFGTRARTFGPKRPLSAALFFTMDRKQSLPSLERSLRTHEVVVQDRSFYSTLAYQGSQVSLRERKELAQLQRELTIVPDLVVLLHGPVDVAVSRVRHRSRVLHPFEKERFLRQVQQEYLNLARRERERFVRIPFDQDPKSVLGAAKAAVLRRVG